MKVQPLGSLLPPATGQQDTPVQSRGPMSLAQDGLQIRALPGSTVTASADSWLLFVSSGLSRGQDWLSHAMSMWDLRHSAVDGRGSLGPEEGGDLSQPALWALGSPL